MDFRRNFLGSRLAVLTFCCGFLRFFRAGQFVTPAAGFFYVATFFQPMQDARKEAASMMFQLHAVGDLADAGGLGKRREVGQNEFRAKAGGRGLYLWVLGMTLVRRAHRVSIS